ncbi:3-deoxy-D-manno-octulosonic-acid transferase [Desulfonatronum thiosulfatophilum]|uniref:3-deoxy-D-manno-octulosonic acid transferase n=1 Tax=Desulfonatronum thiosulfatophilum TaxID=617002 RepID=A0A1G6DNZ1_9BACT|nr:glycosyltransferase N-terminal domain-containing protein [Desulfonatronum thiosulfatophilum]SDB46858.1 3-deoxy-D-manno-octulosonic-acid transferase [Desulfonatronum thiosulfatophilum]
MLLFYRLLFLPALFLVLPFYIPRMLRRGGYGEHFAQRLGMVPVLAPKRHGERRIWAHAVSVGEILALAPLLELLRQDESVQIVLTTTTSTAHALAERKYGADVTHLGYFPLDFWPVSHRVWKRLQPDLCVLMESEIWPEHLHQARQRNVPVALINARMSERSFVRWQVLPRCLRKPFAMLDKVVAASEEDGRRYAGLGTPADRIVVSGNLKLDFTPRPLLQAHELDQLRRELGFWETRNAGQPLVLAGASTWPGEEEMLLRVATSLREHGQPCKLLLIPRHAERRNALREMLAWREGGVHFRTDGPATAAVNVAVADTTGEMVALLQIADVVFVGKSMDPHRGGQNPIEAAALGKTVLFGPNMQNFRAIAASMTAAGAGEVVRGEQELTDRVRTSFQDQAAREERGRAARRWHQSGKGAAQRTLTALDELTGR